MKPSNIEKTASGNMKTICVSNVLGFFGIDSSKFKYTWNERTRKNVWTSILRRAGYSVRSRKSYYKNMTVSQLKNKIVSEKAEKCYYVVAVEKHILLVDFNGVVRVDTDPRKRDRRKVKYVYAVVPHGYENLLRNN